jgi:hypothetical protein
VSLATAPFRLVAAPFRKKRRLTDTYLDDPHVRDFAEQVAQQRAAKDSAA